MTDTSATSSRVPRGHRHAEGLVGWIGTALHIPGFAHSHGESESIAVDAAVRDNTLGIMTVWIALGLLWLTTALQAVIYLSSNSVALLADTGHNLVDALNSIPLLIALYLARRPATRRYTYGLGRAEDIAGIAIVISILYSAYHIMQESIARFYNPFPLENPGLVALAAAIGFFGNEAVATLQIRVGKRIGSAAMVADGQHARVDGITSLAVLIAVAGSALNVPLLDPIIGVLIGVAIVGIAISATRTVLLRLMDGLDPALVNRIEHFAGTVDGVEQIVKLRARWVGHRLFVEITAAVDEMRSLVEGHSVAQRIQRALHDAIPAMGEVVVSIEPAYAHSGSRAAPAPLQGASMILPPRYQNQVPSAAPMGAAALKYDDEGNAAWDEIWTDFCDLALAGGPPHRGTLLEPAGSEQVSANPEAYESVLQELERGLKMVTGLAVVRSAAAGWIGLRCTSEDMALWLLRAILVENVSVRREGATLFFPAGPDFRLEKEIKNVVTVVAKTHHYWQEHISAA